MPSVKGFFGGDNTLYSPTVADATLINMYPEIAPQESSTTKGYFIKIPGTSNITQWDITGMSGEGDAGCRGLYTSSRGVLYGVYGQFVYKFIDEDTPPVKLYTISYGTTPCKFADNGKHILIADGTSLHLIDMYSNVGLTPTLPTGVHPTHVVVLDGRAVINCVNYSGTVNTGAAPPDTRLYYSELYDATIWTSGSAGSTSAIATADPILAIEVCNDQIICLGSKTVEWKQSTEDPYQPFMRVGGSSVGNGIYAPYSSVIIGRSCYWLGVESNGSVQVYRNNGYQIETISTPGIEWALATVDNLSPVDMIGGTYSQAGHTFYVITSNFMRKTFVYDPGTNLWHRRSTRGTNGEIFDWRYIYFASLNAKTYVGRKNAEQVYNLALDVYDEFDGKYIVCERTTGIIQDDLNGIVHNSLKLIMQTGVGNSLSLISEEKYPQASLQISDTANGSWSPEIYEDIGVDNNSGRKVQWWALGYAVMRSYRIRISAPIKVVLLDLIINAKSTGR